MLKRVAVPFDDRKFVPSLAFASDSKTAQESEDEAGLGASKFKKKNKLEFSL